MKEIATLLSQSNSLLRQRATHMEEEATATTNHLHAHRTALQAALAKKVRLEKEVRTPPTHPTHPPTHPFIYPPTRPPTHPPTSIGATPAARTRREDGATAGAGGEEAETGGGRRRRRRGG